MAGLIMYAIVRADIDIPKGKFGVQTGHAFVHALLTAPPEVIVAYHGDPEHKKITLAAKDEAHLHELAAIFAAANVPHHLVTDFAHTVFTEPTVTCLGVGPLDADTVHRLKLKKLPLYKKE